MGLFDYALTMWFQDPAYWAGDYKKALEANPLFSRLMEIHPLLFFGAGALVWTLFFGWLLLNLPRLAARCVCLCLTIGHTWGASSWLTMRVEDYYWVNIALSIFCGVLLTLSLEAAGER